MSATHQIDKENKLIVTTWEGEPTGHDLSQAFKSYQKNIKSKPEYVGYDELVDCSQIDGFKLNAEDLKILAHAVSLFDESISQCKLAIVVKSNLAYIVATTYVMYRSLCSKTKDIRVFISKGSALKWLAGNEQ